MTDQRFYQLALTMINGVGDILCRHLLQTIGTPEDVFRESPSLLERISGIGRALALEIKNKEVFEKAEKELLFVEKNNIDCLFFTEEQYPYRLKECADAPVLLYTKGNIKINTSHIISIVGTRNATQYGKELTQELIKELSSLLPDLLIISGLAYGIDANAHQRALEAKLSTVGVLAHGLDRIYPYTHREMAVEMLQNGGLITDFPSGTRPDKPNFVRRNRIVAGLSDATIVVESAGKGGSLITADIAFSYGRDVFTFPGRVYDKWSEGCNKLIKQNKAALITDANDLLSAMCWDVNEKSTIQPVQAELFFSLDEKSNRIIQLLTEYEELHINQLSRLMEVAVYELSVTLFELEMNGLVKILPGNIYRKTGR